MSKFKIQRYNKTITVPLGANTIKSTPLNPVNGILKGLTVRPPASITGSSYAIKVLDYAGQVMFSKSTLAAGSTAGIFTDANDMYINIPIANNADVALFQIDIAGDTTPSGVLTSDNSGNVTNGKKVTIGDIVYTFKTALSVTPTAYEVLIGSDADDTLLNLKKAINAEAGAGTKYGVGTVANPYVTSGNVTAHAITVTAVEDSAAENAVVTTTDEATLSWGDTTLADGGEAADRAFVVDAYIER